MTDEQTKKLREVYGCLRLHATKDSEARRRCGAEIDEDGIVTLQNDTQAHERPFAVDFDNKLMPSKALRRAGDKTQVITSPDNRHIRNRATHTYEVISVATMISGILGLNTDLTRAIALGHDLGHPPFGHAGDEALSTLTGKKFKHDIFASVIFQHIERDGRGLNLTHQVLEGIVGHSGVPHQMETLEHISPEANVVRLADKIAYITADYNDVQRFGVKPDDFCAVVEYMNMLGKNQRERTKTLVTALCLESAAEHTISFKASEEAIGFAQVRTVMKEKIYQRLNVFGCKAMLEKLFTFVASVVPNVQPEIVIALMTDGEALWLAHEQTLNISHLYATSVGDIIPILKGKVIDFTDPDLNW